MSAAGDRPRSHGLLRALADRIDATDPGACNNLGVLYYSKGLHAEAVQAFLRALAIAPRMRLAARNLAVAATQPGACDAPVAALEARLAANAADQDARRELARLNRLLGRPLEARAHLETLLAVDPDDAIALREAGLLEQADGDLRRARRWLEHAVAAAPDDAWARLHLAEVHYHRGANAAALETLDALHTVDARIADAWLLRSFVLGDLGRDDEAREAARQARALDPAIAALQSNLALDAHRAPPAGVSTGGGPAIPVAHGLAPTPVRSGVISNQSLARYSLGLAFRQRGYFAEARRELARAHAHGEDSLLVEHALAELDLVQGAPREARRRYEALLAEREDDARLWNELGVARHQAGEVVEAADHYRRALRADPRDALAFNNLGVALADLGDPTGAREALQRAVQLDPTLVRARLNLARWYQQQGDALSALVVTREVLAFRPREAEAWHEQAVALLALDHVDEARHAVLRAVEQQPDHGEARYTLADILARLGDTDGALRETQHALGLVPVRVAPRLAVGIALHAECPDAVGRLDLLTLVADRPLAGTAVDGERIAELLPQSRPTDGAAGETTASLVASLDASLAAAETHLRAAEFDEARRLAEAVLRRCTDRVRVGALHVEPLASVIVADTFAARGVHGEAHERYGHARRALEASGAVRADAERAVWSRAMRGEIRTACLLGRGVEVVSLADRFSTAETADPEVLALLAATHAARGDAYGRQVAEAAIRRLVARAPASAALLHFAGDAARSLDDPALAIVCYRRALTVDPTRPSPRLAVAQLLRVRGDVLAAHLELVAALAAAPGWPDGVRALARLHLEADRPDEAARVLVPHLARQTSDTEALVLLAEALHAQGRDAEAREAVLRVRRLEPDHPWGLWLDGALSAAQGRLRDARARWDRLFAVAPSSEAAQRAQRDVAAIAEASIQSWRDVGTTMTTPA